MSSGDLPAALRRMWRVAPPSSRLGRPSNLDIDTVVGTAVRLADAGGLDAATLPRVAAELRVTAMSLYRHVGSKQELVQLMADAACTPRPPSVGSAGAWRADLRDTVTALWELYRRRPWLAHVPTESAPTGPNQMAWLDRALASLDVGNLGWDERLRIVMLLSGHVRQSILLTQDLAAGRPANEEQAASEARYGRAMRELIESDQLPQVSALLDSDVFADTGASTEATARADFDAGLEILLDGVAARLEIT
ncbi:TetR/AcrR family transcriptional regulator [Gordonia sp. (in: high G+C Gram-positive bacteria)]|uniref:TetR/AcrR family transcriptional regulator n=1 Tax=Gordonia sp. (in: high G+C Gram-positive bacteria) TaxID=84139 RepID=UPI003F9C517A